MTNMATAEIKAFVPAKDFELSKPGMRKGVLPLLSLALAACATVPPPGAKLMWAGTIQDVEVARTPDTGSPTGFSILNGERRLLSPSQFIPAVVGTSFGAGWKFEGMPDMPRVSYTARWVFPPQGLTNPNTGVQSFSTEVRSYCMSDRICTTAWKLVEPWEAVPGVWQLEIWQGERLVLAQDFTLFASRLPTGRWDGSILWTEVPTEPGEDSKRLSVIFANCTGNPRIWIRNDADGRFGRSTMAYQATSLEGTHVLYGLAQADGPTLGWVESDVWTLVQIEPQRLIVRASRSVHNRAVELNDPLRNMGNSAYGELRRVSSDCGDFR